MVSWLKWIAIPTNDYSSYNHLQREILLLLKKAEQFAVTSYNLGIEIKRIM
jgi:hypothetical protein